MPDFIDAEKRLREIISNSKFTFNGDSVTCVGKTESEIAKQYIATTSGIVQPDTSLIV